MARAPHRGAYRRGQAQFSRAPNPPPPVNGYTIALVSPVSGHTSREVRPSIQFRPTSILGNPVDVEIEWRTTIPIATGPEKTWLPVPTYAQTETGLASGEDHTVLPPTDLTYNTWYYRLRAGSVATGVWGEWSAADRHIDIQPPVGSVVSYLELNIGAPRPTAIGAIAYTDMNVGTMSVAELPSAAIFSDMNVGILPSWKLTSSYSDMNVHPVLQALAGALYSDMNVNTEKPEPVIWWIRPEQGKEGYIFNIYGHGFGAFENEYDGKVMLGDFQCQIAVWEVVPASGSPEDFTIVHGEALEPDVITPEHGWIVAVVPTGAVSAMVKVVLEGG